MLHDTWDMLVVDFASLAIGMLGSGGFFNKLKANTHQIKPLKGVNVAPVKGNTICIGFVPTAEEIERTELELQDDFIENALKSHEETMFDLFPEARNRSPIKITPDDIDKLKVKFENLISDVVEDRNNHRAHKYERARNENQFDKLNFSTLNDRFQKIEEMLNKIRLLVCNNSFAHMEMNFASKEETARDLVLMVVWGANKLVDIESGINDKLNEGVTDPVSNTYGYMLRDRLVEESHRYHDRVLNGDLDHEGFSQNEKEKFHFNNVNMQSIRKLI